MTKKIFLGLGSNRGNREKNLVDAINMISKRVGNVTSASPVYETDPWGFQSNERFLNMVLAAGTELEPEQVIGIILQIEKGMGRKRSGSGYESRIIDIDFLLFENMVISKEGLTVPHPLMHKRRFVLVPLCDINAYGVHPVLKRTFAALLEECPDNNVVRFYKSVLSIPKP